MDFNVLAFWLDIAYFGLKFDILGVNMGQMLNFNTLTPKRHITASFCIFWGIKHQNPSRVWPLCMRHKKII